MRQYGIGLGGKRVHIVHPERPATALCSPRVFLDYFSTDITGHPRMRRAKICATCAHLDGARVCTHCNGTGLERTDASNG